MVKDKGNTAQAAAQAASSLFTVSMTQDKVTKGAVRYTEDHVTETEADKIGQLYVKKSAFASGAPNQIRVTVEGL